MYREMKLQALLLLTITSIVAATFTCSDTDCYECVENTCHLTCQGEDCRKCSSGNCCTGTNCNVCVASVYCSNAKCNECVNVNRKSCYKGASACDDLIGEKCGVKADKQVLDFSGSYASQLHNITTVIKIQNLINNTNLLHAPIVVNLTNVNDVFLNNTKRKSCCSIVHPQECHKISNALNRICFTRRHTECSTLCGGGATNLLIKVARNSTYRCIVIAVHPYYYCGYYITEDCSACFNCEKESKTQCLEKSTCSNTCRLSILPTRFYNVPYYIQSTATTGQLETPLDTEEPGTPPTQR